MGHLDFLVVNEFLTTQMDARAIKSAIDLGLLGTWISAGPRSLSELSRIHRINPRGLRLLVDMLEINGVVARVDDVVDLTPRFRAALRFRDLLETRIAFADWVWPDIHELFTPLLNDLPQFMARSRVFDLFRYDRCLQVTAENLEAARTWTRFTTCLTKYEAGAVLHAVDFTAVRHFVDLGGNTGEFAFRLCSAHADLRATVVDLPVVCELGGRHIAANASAAERERIVFFPTDMRRGPLPAPADLVAFKSVLHDWPDEDALSLLERAGSLVRPGGRILIFERAPIELGGSRPTYAMAPDLVFLHFLRPAALYVDKLRAIGFVDVEHRRLELDIGFHLVTARRPES
jgi:SAM-dependent methyltransferase